ncbi:unnamed protein product [Trichogramma brassicae]|uniref:Uncharacterized protein n=1 Tax=Trichogramma brassicae TaxID=86971 RepID=A0A6H5HVY2_9HYME|nr:unnamed protein product [Trichogramma brassicae]
MKKTKQSYTFLIENMQTADFVARSSSKQSRIDESSVRKILAGQMKLITARTLTIISHSGGYNPSFRGSTIIREVLCVHDVVNGKNFTCPISPPPPRGKRSCFLLSDFGSI